MPFEATTTRGYHDPQEFAEFVEDTASAHTVGGCGIHLSDGMVAGMEQLRKFLMTNMYRHPRVASMSRNGKRVVTDLFNLYIEEPLKMPEEWSAQTGAPGTSKTARVAADFIAGMTDRYALLEHAKHFGDEIK